MKHGIRAPRKPAAENLSVTVANQDKQIKLLIDRVASLEKEAREANAVAARQRGLADELRKDWVNLKSGNDYSNGYIARVKEEDKHRHGGMHSSFPSDTMGP